MRKFKTSLTVVLALSFTHVSYASDSKISVAVNKKAPFTMGSVGKESVGNPTVRKDITKPSAALVQGGDSGGGGGMVIVNDGIVKLADLTMPNENFVQSSMRQSPVERDAQFKKLFKKPVVTAYDMSFPTDASFDDYIARHMIFRENVREPYFPPHIGLRQIPLPNNTPIGTLTNYLSVFSTVGELILFQEQFPVLNNLTKARCGVHTMIVLYHQPLNIKVADNAANNFYSSRFPKEIQRPVAFFHNNLMYISAQLLSGMDERNRTALGVHECLRHLNSDVLEQGLSTDEIEALTRHLMKMPFPNDQALVSSAKKKLMKPVKNPGEWDSWVKGYQDKLRCEEYAEQARKNRRNMKWEEMTLCWDHTLPNYGEYADRTNLLCVMENPNHISWWKDGDAERFAQYDIRQVIKWFSDTVKSEHIRKCDWQGVHSDY